MMRKVQKELPAIDRKIEKKIEAQESEKRWEKRGKNNRRRMKDFMEILHGR